MENQKVIKNVQFQDRSFFVDAIPDMYGHWTGSHDAVALDFSVLGSWKNESCNQEYVLTWTPNHFGLVKCENKHQKHSTICAYPLPPDTSMIIFAFQRFYLFLPSGTINYAEHTI